MREFSFLSEGREWFKKLLESKGFQDVQETPRYCRWDVEGYYGGEKWCFELKNRSFDSGRFGDVAVNKDKYDYLLGLPHRVVLVEFFTDRWCLIDVKNRRPDDVIIRECPRTTRFEDRTLRDNSMVIWKTKNMFMLDYDQERNCG